MAVSRLKALAFGTISDPGSATEGLFTEEAQEVRTRDRLESLHTGSQS